MKTTVILETTEMTETNFMPTKFKYKQVSDVDNAFIANTCNNLSNAEGWELFGMIPNPRGNYTTLIFRKEDVPTILKDYP